MFDQDFFSDMFGFKNPSSATNASASRKKEIFSDEEVGKNVSLIYTYSRTISNLKLKPTKSNTFVILDQGSIILEEFDDVLDAKRRYIEITIGSFN